MSKALWELANILSGIITLSLINFTRSLGDIITTNMTTDLITKT